MNFAGLSTDQAPPISAPLRFFLTAPIFGMIAGIFLFFSDSSILINRYSIDTIMATHLITIGFFASIMLGALTQMLPVLAGAKMKKVELIAKISHTSLVVGLISMLIGFIDSNSVLNTIAMILFSTTFLLMLGNVAFAITTVNNFNATVKGMAVSTFFGFLTVIMGIYLLYSYSYVDIFGIHHIVANIHSVIAIFGFAGILIIGVAFQVLPMFYVAPKFKKFCKRYVIFLISAGLFLWAFLNSFYEEYALFAKAIIALFFWAFATTVWIKLNRRKRPISDVTIWYWRAASIFLTLGSFLWIFDEFFKHEYIVMVGILIGGGFILSILVGMLYKIIPFLVWFHLNALGYMSIPTITEMISIKTAKAQFIFLISAIVGFVFAFYFPQMLKISALSFTVSMALLQYNIIAPVLIYKETKKRKPDFDMSSFSMDSYNV